MITTDLPARRKQYLDTLGPAPRRRRIPPQRAARRLRPSGSGRWLRSLRLARNAEMARRTAMPQISIEFDVANRRNSRPSGARAPAGGLRAATPTARGAVGSNGGEAAVTGGRDHRDLLHPYVPRPRLKPGADQSAASDRHQITHEDLRQLCPLQREHVKMLGHFPFTRPTTSALGDSYASSARRLAYVPVPLLIATGRPSSSPPSPARQVGWRPRTASPATRERHAGLPFSAPQAMLSDPLSAAAVDLRRLLQAGRCSLVHPR